MVYWHGKTLAELDRTQIEAIASKAIEELVSINNYNFVLWKMYLVNLGYFWIVFNGCHFYVLP